MGAVLEAVRDEVEKTIRALDRKKFAPDPIAGPHFSKITSVLSSAYKRHGYILERGLLEALKTCPDFDVWREDNFQVPSAVDHIVAGSILQPTALIGTDYPYSTGHRTLQVDVIVFDKRTGVLRAYEVKRGNGAYDSGKRRSITRDILSIQVLLKNYGKSKGLAVTEAVTSSSITDASQSLGRSASRAMNSTITLVGRSTPQSRRSTSTSSRDCSGFYQAADDWCRR